MKRINNHFSAPMLGCAVIIIFVILFHNAGFQAIISAIIFGILVLIISIKRYRSGYTALLPLILIATASISLYSFDGFCEYTERAVGTSLDAELLIVDEPQIDFGKITAKAKIRKHPILSEGTGIRLEMSSDNSGSVKMGDIIKVKLKVTASSAQISDNMKSNGILAKAKCKSVPAVTGCNAFLSAAGKTRAYVRSVLKKGLSAQEGSVLCALLIGDRTAISEELENAVRCAGLSHVLVVSGMHFATIMSGFSLLLRRFGIGKRLQVFFSIGAVIFFSAVCGFTMSVMRAGVTYLLAAGAILFRRDGEPLNLLSGAVAFILAFSPYAIFSISFQLSVLATMGVLVIMPPASQAVILCLPRLKPIKGIIDAFVGSLAAMFMTMPVTLWYFGEFSVASPTANVLTSYPITWALLAAGAALLLTPLPFISKPLLMAAGLLVRWFCYITELFGVEELMLPIGKTGCIIFAVIIAAILIVIYRSRERRIYLKLKRVMEDGSYNGK